MENSHGKWSLRTSCYRGNDNKGHQLIINLWLAALHSELLLVKMNRHHIRMPIMSKLTFYSLFSYFLITRQWFLGICHCGRVIGWMFAGFIWSNDFSQQKGSRSRSQQGQKSETVFLQQLLPCFECVFLRSAKQMLNVFEFCLLFRI